MESAVTAPVSGHVKRVVVQEGVFSFPSYVADKFILSLGDSINQGDLVVEIVH